MDVVQDAIPGNVSVPEYPPEAIAEGVSGSVTVEFTISNIGTVTELNVKSSDLPKEFESAAISVARWSSFYPTLKNCEEVASTGTFTYLFDGTADRMAQLGGITVNGAPVGNSEPFQQREILDSAAILELVRAIEDRPQKHVHPEIREYETIRPRVWWSDHFLAPFVARYVIGTDGKPHYIKFSKPIALVWTLDGNRNRPNGQVLKIRRRAKYTISKWRFNPGMSGKELCQRFYVFRNVETGDVAIPDNARVLNAHDQ